VKIFDGERWALRASFLLDERPELKKGMLQETTLRDGLPSADPLSVPPSIPPSSFLSPLLISFLSPYTQSQIQPKEDRLNSRSAPSSPEPWRYLH